MNVRSNRATRYGIADMPHVRLYSMVLVLMADGCAGPVPVQPASFDGSYRSTIRITSSSEVIPYSWCETPGQPIITVANQQFSYTVPHPNIPGKPPFTYTATIAPDGTFVGEGSDGSGRWRRLRISGQIRGTHMEGSIDGEACIYAFAGDRM
jgi:hypothetical protein